MADRFTLAKISCIILPLIGFALIFWVSIWGRLERLEILMRELELARRVFQIKEANFENAEANKAKIEGYTLVDMDDAIFVALDIGSGARARGFIETDFNTIRLENRLGDISLVRTKITCGLIGQYAGIMNYMRTLKENFIFDNIGLSSSGMEQGNVSVSLELSLYSLLEPSDFRPTTAAYDYFEDYDYENPFRY